MKKMTAGVLVFFLLLAACAKTDADEQTMPPNETPTPAETHVLVSPAEEQCKIDDSSAEITLLSIFLRSAAGPERPVWEELATALTGTGFEFSEDEGTFSADDPINTGCWLGGVLTNENGTVEVASLSYHTTIPARHAEVEFAGAGAYYISASKNREQVDSLDALKAYLLGEAETETPADPTYYAEGIVSGNGLTEDYTYEFPAGSIDIAPDEYLLLINGAFIPEISLSGKPEDVSKHTERISNAVVGTLPAGELASHPIIWIEAADMIPDGVRGRLTETLKSQLQTCLNTLTTVDFAEFDYGRYDGWDEAAYHAAFDAIQAKIDALAYVGQAGRYAIFSGPYTILVDTAAGNVVYFYYSGHMMGSIVEPDLTDPATFFPSYFAG